MAKWRRRLADVLLRVNGLLSSHKLSAQRRNANGLVFAPHPDDEVLGCGGVIALKAQLGARVMVVIMTDGRASHGTLIAEDELVRIRRAEAEEAARRLGPGVDYVFLGFEDHRLSRYGEIACDQVANIIHEFHPDEIYLPNRYEDNTDHIETNHIVRRAVERVNRPVVLLEYPVWLWHGWPWTEGGASHSSGKLRGVLRRIRDVTEIVLACQARMDVRNVLDCKRAALAAYRSQTQRLSGDPGWPVLSDVAHGEFLRRLQTEIEIFRVTHYEP